MVEAWCDGELSRFKRGSRILRGVVGADGGTDVLPEGESREVNELVAVADERGAPPPVRAFSRVVMVLRGCFPLLDRSV